MAKDHVRVEGDVPIEEAVRAVYDSLDASDDVEFLAMLALNEGFLGDDTPEELLTCYHEETGHTPRLPEEADV